MIKALENNFIGLALVYSCAGLLAVALGIVVLWLLPASPDEGAAGGEDLDDVPVAALAASKPFEQYAEISSRPVFNEDRRPAPVLDEEDGEGEELLVEEDVDAPDVELAGVVITPSIRMATLKSKEHKYSLVAFEGKPLEGNFGSWQVSRISDRAVTLASADGKELRLELQVHDSVISEPPKPVSAAPEVAAADGAEPQEAQLEAQAQQMSRAEEIRQRIAERREELRRQAEERQANRADGSLDSVPLFPKAQSPANENREQ